MGIPIVLSYLLVLSSALVVAEPSFSTKGSTKPYPVSLNGIHLLAASAKTISAALANGTLTSLDLVDAYIQRLAANDHEGKVNFPSDPMGIISEPHNNK